LRLFTAIDIPADVKAALAALLDRLRPLGTLKWIPVEKLHITTKFIGEWPDKPEARLDELKRSLASVKAPAPVDIVVRGLGRLPRVLYAAVEPNDALTALAAATEQAVEGTGVAAENRVYRPHVTLARTRKAFGNLGTASEFPRSAQSGFGPVADAEIRRQSLVCIGSFRASSFALYLSAGGKYTKLQEFTFT
jgi:2'-5' RNA ligase